MCALWEQRAQPIQEVFCGVFWELHNLSENHLDIYLCNSTEMAEIYRLLGLWDRRSLTQLENLFYWSKHKRLLSLFYIAGSNGSAFKFSSEFEPFEFLDKSFCALWTFFRCLFMFLLAPKFFLHSGHSTPSWNSVCFIICWWFMKERWFSLHVPVIHIHRPGCRLCTLVLWLLR